MQYMNRKWGKTLGKKVVARGGYFRKRPQGDTIKIRNCPSCTQAWQEVGLTILLLLQTYDNERNTTLT